MKTPLTKIPPVIHSRDPALGRGMLGLFLISLIALFLKYQSPVILHPHQKVRLVSVTDTEIFVWDHETKMAV